MIYNRPDFDNTALGDGKNHVELVGMYFYYLEDSLIQGASSVINTGIFNNNSGYIQNVSYNPFLSKDDLVLYKSNFDATAHANVTNESTNVFRIAQMTSITKTISNSYRHEYTDSEPILDAYPYTYYVLYDGFNPPKVLKPQYLNLGQPMNIMVKTGVNQSSKYLLYCRGYKGDIDGNLEGIVNEHPMMLPVGSTAYAQFMATSSASFYANQQLNSMENQLSYRQTNDNIELNGRINESGYWVNTVGNITNGVVSVANALTGNVVGGVSGIANAGLSQLSNYTNYQNQIAVNNLNSTHNSQSYEFSEYANERRAMATITDLKKTPRAMQTTGNDMLFNMQKADNKVMLYKFTIGDSAKSKLRVFYQKYGYIVNRYEYAPSLKTRRCYDFIKMGKCELKSTSVPKVYLDEIKRIYETGITFWHVESNVSVGDYDRENVEETTTVTLNLNNDQYYQNGR
ncbi:MAG: hypothetical protein ACI3T9_07715 [Romboutsia timonensis]